MKRSRRGTATAHIVSRSEPPGGEAFDSAVLPYAQRFRFVAGVAGSSEYEEQLYGASPAVWTLTAR